MTDKDTKEYADLETALLKGDQDKFKTLFRAANFDSDIDVFMALWETAIYNRQLEFLKFLDEEYEEYAEEFDPFEMIRFAHIAIDIDDPEIFQFIYQKIGSPLNINELDAFILYAQNSNKQDIVELLEQYKLPIRKGDFLRNKDGELVKVIKLMPNRKIRVFNYKESRYNKEFESGYITDYEINPTIVEQDYIDILNSKIFSTFLKLAKLNNLDLSDKPYLTTVFSRLNNHIKFDASIEMMSALLELGAPFDDELWTTVVKRYTNWTFNKMLVNFIKRGADPYITVNNVPFALFEHSLKLKNSDLLKQLLEFPEVRHWPQISRYLPAKLKNSLKKEALDSAVPLLQVPGFDYSIVCKIIDEAIYVGAAE